MGDGCGDVIDEAVGAHGGDLEFLRISDVPAGEDDDGKDRILGRNETVDELAQPTGTALGLGNRLFVVPVGESEDLIVAFNDSGFEGVAAGAMDVPLVCGEQGPADTLSGSPRWDRPTGIWRLPN